MKRELVIEKENSLMVSVKCLFHFILQITIFFSSYLELKKNLISTGIIAKTMSKLNITNQEQLIAKKQSNIN